MGYDAKLSAETDGLTDYEAVQLAHDASVWNAAQGAPASGSVSRNGKPIPFTLETTATAPEAYRLLPEQMVIAVVLLASFVIPILHLLR